MTDEVARAGAGAQLRPEPRAGQRASSRRPSMAGVHEDWMERLEDRGTAGPGDRVPADHRGDGRRGAATTRADLAGAGDPAGLHQDRAGRRDLELRPARRPLPGRPADATTSRPRCGSGTPTRCREHRLHREIIATVVVNDFVNTAGITCFHRLSGGDRCRVGRPDPGAASPPGPIFGAADARGRDRGAGPPDRRAVQTELRLEVRTLVERATRWLVNNRRRPIDIGAAVEQLRRAGVRACAARCRDLLSGRDAEASPSG